MSITINVCEGWGPIKPEQWINNRHEEFTDGRTNLEGKLGGGNLYPVDHVAIIWWLIGKERHKILLI